MHLRSVTLRGFKSFADPTTLEFEPGVTVVVGPNGSGKSNVVDAVAWVLGAQGPRVVRSSKMDDVIFAGTSKRPALGRAEVVLTIDNSSRRLPVDLAEVTITRTLFRTGESEYSMNGQPCRLLDIQEMLSDAGVGRMQHVIMSQGQLASVLDARPEERRAVIEEAAGVLKFRRRRERAERRLESTEANLLRLQDLLREVRRQLRPLERQAEAARRHGSLEAELQAVRLFVAGRELDSLRRRTDENEARRQSLSAEEARLQQEIERLDSSVSAGEAALAAEQSNEVVTTLATAERLQERARGVANVISERRRRVEAGLVATTQADVVASLEAESASLQRDVATAEEAGAALGPVRAELERAAVELAKDEASLGEGGRDEEDASGRETVDLRRVRDHSFAELSQAREALARSAERLAALERQRGELNTSQAELEMSACDLAETVASLRESQEASERKESEAAERVSVAESQARDATGRAQALSARAEALQDALDEAHARAGVERLEGHSGVLGTLLDVVEVDEGFELAFEAACEEALGAVVVDGHRAARSAVEHLHSLAAPGAVLAVESPAGALATNEPRMLRSRVRSPQPGVEALLDRLLSGVVACETGIRDALDLAESGDITVVTTDGDRLSAKGWRLRVARSGATRAALEAVQSDAGAADEHAGATRSAAESCRQAWTEARSVAAEASRRAAAASAEERQLATQRQATERRALQLASEAEQLEGAQLAATAKVTALEATVAEHETALSAAEAADTASREAASERAGARRSLEDRTWALATRRADLEVRAAGIEERRALLARRLAEVEQRLEGLESARSGAAERRAAHEATATALSRIGTLTSALLAKVGRAMDHLRVERNRHDEAVAGTTQQLTAARSQRATTERELTAVREQAQRTELERAELRVRLETALESLRHDLDAEVAEALGAVCPELPPGTSPAARVRELERELRLLGPINPLALEELAGLEERDRFLSGQLEDVKNTRRELGRVIRAVDEEIVSVFAQAFSDVAGHFEQLFSTLFPGGIGRLTLLEPDDLLSSGIEIEARPAGRNVRRLSLLSGGERSLAALAFLFAVFRSRPSPFYLMDEVEAALDDVNLHRFLDLVDEFRKEAQLVIVSHQKRTMESADVIYGVTMQAGGASKVVSERLRDSEQAGTALTF